MDAAAVTPAEKIAFLRSAGAQPDDPAGIELVETHFAWIFLGERFVYKLKKPIRFERIDFVALESRRASCELELTLNRRLAELTYLAIVPLTLSHGELRLGGSGTVVDWLIKMRRLPNDRTLEVAAREGTVSDRELQALLRKLERFYAHTPVAPWSGEEYRHVLATRARDHAARLAESNLLDRGAIERITESRLRFLERRAADLDRRVARGRVVDAHGDLRPEHVFLGENPQIIDCLEFSIELRWLDTAEELAFLALECEHAGAAELANRLLAAYREVCNDDVAHGLLDYYFAQRAVVRAMLYTWRLADAPADRVAYWHDRVTRYLRTAEERVGRANAW